MTASIISIGDELLSGTTLDTNSNWIAKQLQAIGIELQAVYTIHDDISSIIKTLEIASKDSDIIFTTGGLGPTRDDKTKKALAQFFHDEIVFDSTTFEHLKNYLESKNRADILKLNRDQACVLSTAKIFQNHYGTAPCQMIKNENVCVFCLPGVPFEVKPFLTHQIIPYLVEKEAQMYFVTRNLTVVGIPESLLAERIKEWEDELPQNISLSYLPTGSRIKLKLTSSGGNKAEVEQLIDKQVVKLFPLIKDYLIASKGDKIEEIFHEIILNKKLTISSAESFTSGRLSALLTSNPGSSSYFLGGVTAYSSDQKVNLLGVKQETIDKYTVVSKETAEEMAKGVQKLFKSDIALSTTGVAGPGKGEDGKDVGTAYFTVRIGNESETSKIYLPHFERDDFANFVAQKVLEKLCVLLIKG